MVEIYMPHKNFWRIFKDGSKYYIKNVYYKYVKGDLVKYGVLRESTLNHVYEWKVILEFKQLDENDVYVAKFRNVKLSKITKPISSS